MKKTIFGSLLLLVIAFGYSSVLANETDSTNNTSANTPVVSSILLKASQIQNKVEWFADGLSKQGFKVVWSKNQGPTYPTRDGDKYHYFENPSYKYDVLDPFSGEGTYYVRVCQYLDGACGIYSNEVTVNLAAISDKKPDMMNKNNNMMDNRDNNKPQNNRDNNSNLNNITDPSQLPAGYEKIVSIDDIKNYEKIIKVGDTDLYGIKMTIKIPDGKEWIKSLADIKYFKNIQKIGDHLYGIRISDEKKLQIQKKINDINDQIKKLQDQLSKLNNDLASIQ